MLTLQISTATDKDTVRAVLAAIFTLHPDLADEGVSTGMFSPVTDSPAPAPVAPVVNMPPETVAGPPAPSPAFGETPAPFAGDPAPTAAPPPPPPETSGYVAPVSTATPAPPPAAPSPAPSVELDVSGLPWDARIHTGTKAKNSDGSWRAKRGVPADTITAVTAELRQVLAAPAAPVVPLAAAPATAPTAAVPGVVVPPAATAPAVPGPDGQTGSPAAPPPPAAPAAAPPPPAVPLATPPAQGAADAAAATGFAGAMRKVTALQQANQLTVADVQGVCAGLGLAQVRDLLHRPDLVPAFESQVDALAAANAFNPPPAG